MRVTGIGANTFNVIRGVRNTMAVAHQGDTTAGQTVAPETVYQVLTTTLNEPGNLAAAPTTTIAATSGLDNSAATITFDVTDVGFAAALVNDVSVLRIDAEEMLVRNVAGTTITVDRGSNGTAVEGHGRGTTVTQVDATIDVLDTVSMTLGNTPFIRIDNEVMRVLSIGVSSINVLRTANGSSNASHVDGASIERVLSATLSASSRTAAQVATAILTALTSAGITATGADILTNLGTTGVVPGSAPATPVSVQFTGALGSHDWQPLRINTSNLVGDDIDQVSLGVSFIGGTFQLQFVTTTLGILTTPAGVLNYNATQAALETELDSTLGVGNYRILSFSNVGGAGTAINSFSIQFTGRLQDQAVTTSVLDSTSLQNQEINTLRRTAGAAPTSGTFDLTITAAGVTTVNVTGVDAISFNDSGTTIQGKINNAITTAGVTGSVTVSPVGGQFDTGTTYTITFTGDYDDRNVTFSFSNNTLNNGATPLITTVIDGGIGNGTVSPTRVGTGVFGNVFTTNDGVLSVFSALTALPTTLLNGGTADLQLTGGDLPLTDVNITFLDPSFTAANQPRLLLVNNSQMVNTDGLDGGAPVAGEAESFVDITGSPGDGLPDSFLIQVPGLNNPTGLAFSPLDFNLWHPTTRRNSDPGHGINTAYDNSRTSTAGNNSFYFGLEQSGAGHLNYPNAQLGILNGIFQSDLTSNAAIIDNNTDNRGGYNLPGGAYGSLITNPFDLTSNGSSTVPVTNLDRPVMYFNYFLETEDQNTNTPDGSMRDGAGLYLDRRWRHLGIAGDE